MRNMLILGAVGILSVAAWFVTSSARAQGLGSAHRPYSQERSEVRTVPVRRFAGHIGHTFFATELETQVYVLPGEPDVGPVAPGMFTGAAFVGGTDHMTAGHLTGTRSHTNAQVHARVEQRDPLTSEPAAPGGGESNDTGAATAQPNSTANPSWARPPGASGPGRPVSGWSGPGLPGPGRPASRGW
jgi:hypothetical protein